MIRAGLVAVAVSLCAGVLQAETIECSLQKVRGEEKLVPQTVILSGAGLSGKGGHVTLTSRGEHIGQAGPMPVQPGLNGRGEVTLSWRHKGVVGLKVGRGGSAQIQYHATLRAGREILDIRAVSLYLKGFYPGDFRLYAKSSCVVRKK